MFFLTSRHVKQGRQFVKDVRKLLAYRRDLLDAATIAEAESGIAALESAVATKNRRTIEEAAGALDKTCGKFVKPPPDAGWRENCEVFLVAIVVALGVRTYFLQPFTIPTGSMFPTLNGIIGKRTEEPPPNIVSRLALWAWRGRHYVDIVAKSDDRIVDVKDVKAFPFTDWAGPIKLVTRTAIVCEKNTYITECPKETLFSEFRVPSAFKAGDVLARGYYETGDHVFVDKMTYHFRPPKRGEVFVFNTQNIPTRENQAQFMQGPSQYYIKRLAGLPGDTLLVRPPELCINGKRAEGFGFERVMAAQGQYRGYSNGADNRMGGSTPMKHLTSPDDPYQVLAKQYFALGDNSYHSSDSRDWGTVPQSNIMGRGVLVYWPFAQHFGIIR